MNNSLFIFAVCFFAGAWIFSLILTPCCIALAKKINFYDIPACEQHKQHRKPTPLLGGLAMFGAWVLTFAVAALALVFCGKNLPANVRDVLGGLANVRTELTVLITGLTASVALGLYDDKWAMKAWKKLIGQIIIAAGTAIWGGAAITLFVGGPVVPFCLTVFWFVLIFNAINFFDNMDGLASGTAVIAFVFFCTAACINGQWFVAVLSAVSAGAALGFWCYNKAPAKLFMGDSGSHFLAFLLAYISVKTTYFTPEVSSTHLSVLIPLFILAIPLLDTLTVVLIRLKNHKPVYIGDHNHISHRFWHMGLTRPHAVMMVHLLSLISGLGALPLLWGDAATSIILAVQGIVIYLLIFFLQYAVTHGDSANENK